MKKALNPFLLLLILIFTASCYRVTKVTQRDLFLDPAEKVSLTAQCREINSSGNILELLAEIKNETKVAFAILEHGDVEDQAIKLEKIANSVEKKAAIVMSLSKTEWTTEMWNYEAQWTVNKNDFTGLIDPPVEIGFKITDFEIQDIFFAGVRRSDLINKFSIHGNRREVVVSYKAQGTSLELCQMNRTLMVILKAKYKNFANNSQRYFNLTID